jgi:hypothetical protein
MKMRHTVTTWVLKH